MVDNYIPSQEWLWQEYQKFLSPLITRRQGRIPQKLTTVVTKWIQVTTDFQQLEQWCTDYGFLSPWPLDLPPWEEEECIKCNYYQESYLANDRKSISYKKAKSISDSAPYILSEIWTTNEDYSKGFINFITWNCNNAFINFILDKFLACPFHSQVYSFCIDEGIFKTKEI